MNYHDYREAVAEATYCETCYDDCMRADVLDRHDPVMWLQEGNYRKGTVVYDSSIPDAYWVIPDVLENEHEVEVRVVWAGRDEWIWDRTVYDDHVRGV